MNDKGAARQLWLEGFERVQALHAEIIRAVQNNDDELPDRLNALIFEYDREIRLLPFSELNSLDVAALQPEIEILKEYHHQLTETAVAKRQSLLNQSSQSRKASRSIKAYRNTQDI